MTWEDVDQYLIPAVKNLYGEDRATHAEDLDKKLGVSWYKDLCHPETSSRVVREQLPEEAKKLYQALAGPHGKTILKAYRIKKGLE